MDLIEKVKRIAVIALVSDDVLLDLLVLKGGNAINLIHQLTSRASIDLDYSIEGDLDKDQITGIETRIKSTLEKTFQENGFKLFDFRFYEKPKVINEKVKHFWGGYAVEFKIIENEKAKNLKDIEELRKNAVVLGRNNSTKYSIEISKHEFVEKKADYKIDSFTLYAYTPEMIICEKIRALCQQVDGYRDIVKSFTRKSRARDFFDIYTLMEHFNIDLTIPENIELLKQILDAKHVPINFLKRIYETMDLHEESFPGLKDTLKPSENIKDYDFYFKYVLKIVDKIIATIEN